MSEVQRKVNARAVPALVGIVACFLLSGCQALANMRAQQEAQRQATEDDLRERLAALSPDQKDAVQKCSSIAVGRVAALRNADQGAGLAGVNDYTITDACLDNQYYYEVIPAPTVVINTPPPQRARDGGMASYQPWCLAAQAAGVGACY